MSSIKLLNSHWIICSICTGVGQSEFLAAGCAAQWLWRFHGLDVHHANTPERAFGEGGVTATHSEQANQTCLVFFTLLMPDFS